MERIQVLIDKLQQQKKQNESIEQMLTTVQILQNELASLQSQTKVLGTSKVSVILPVTHIIHQPSMAEPPIVASPQPPAAPKETPKMQTVIPFEAAPLPQPEVKQNEYSLQKPKLEEPAQKPLPAEHAPYFNGQFDVVVEAPTLMQQQIHKEVHELITNHQEELNDKLKESRTELAHKLKEAPVKDLRKAIGINDKFALINDLFRGDEAMYERSIKTINGFHILQEAEYWINRELKVKLGWNDSKEIVQHFYQLVRRRFS